MGTLYVILESLHQNQLSGSSKSCSLKRLQQFLGTWLVQFKGIRRWFCLFLHTVCVAGPLPGVHGGQEVAWLTSHLAKHLKLLNVLLNPHSWYFIIYVFCHCGFCWSALYTQQTACLSVLGQGSLLFVLHENCSIVLSVKRGFFSYPNRGFKDRGGAICCTDFKAP